MLKLRILASYSYIPGGGVGGVQALSGPLIPLVLILTSFLFPDGWWEGQLGAAVALRSLELCLREWRWVALCLPDSARSELDTTQCVALWTCSASTGQDIETYPHPTERQPPPSPAGCARRRQVKPSLENLQKTAPSPWADMGMRRHQPWLCLELRWQIP